MPPKVWEVFHQQGEFCLEFLIAVLGPALGKFENVWGVFWHSMRISERCAWLALFEHCLDRAT
jgi:hypothetical protein